MKKLLLILIIAETCLAVTPNPAQWQYEPIIFYNDPCYYHQMAAVVGSDPNGPVEYYFKHITGDGNDSGWQGENLYAAGPYLDPNPSSYRVFIRSIDGYITCSSQTYLAEDEYTSTLEDSNSYRWDSTICSDSNSEPNVVLTISSGDNGSVTLPGEGDFEYAPYPVVELTAVADTNWCFMNWSGDTANIADVNSATTTIFLDANYSIVANFTNQKTITSSASNGGSMVLPGIGTYTYCHNAVVPITANNWPNHHFVNWTGDTVRIADADAMITTIVADSNYTIKANFAVNEANQIPLAPKKNIIGDNANYIPIEGDPVSCRYFSKGITADVNISGTILHFENGLYTGQD